MFRLNLQSDIAMIIAKSASRSFCCFLLFLCLNAAHGGEIQELRVPSSSPLNHEVCFYYRLPDRGVKSNPAVCVLLMIPGINGDGRMFLQQEAWTRFADREGLALVSPTFQTDMGEIHSGKGYYYPGLWSGQVALDSVKRIGEKSGFKADKILVFGFSAGAHFAHRFALWKPEKVAAFVAYSAGWWDEPTEALKSVPALIMCGDKDERYEPTLAFMQRGLALHLPWIWRSYRGQDHVITPEVVAMAQAFLAHYARGEMAEPFAGDMQSYQYFDEKSDEAGRIPEELRVTLPSRAVAEVWKVENLKNGE